MTITLDKMGCPKVWRRCWFTPLWRWKIGWPSAGGLSPQAGSKATQFSQRRCSSRLQSQLPLTLPVRLQPQREFVPLCSSEPPWTLLSGRLHPPWGAHRHPQAAIRGLLFSSFVWYSWWAFFRAKNWQSTHILSFHTHNSLMKSRQPLERKAGMLFGDLLTWASAGITSPPLSWIKSPTTRSATFVSCQLPLRRHKALAAARSCMQNLSAIIHISLSSARIGLREFKFVSKAKFIINYFFMNL